MRHEAEAGDVVLVARTYDARLVSRGIRKLTGSWYTHAMVALGQGRYAHSIPGEASVVLVENETQMSRLMSTGAVHDLFRPQEPADSLELEKTVRALHAKSQAIRAPGESWPCAHPPDDAAAYYSDGHIVALALLRLFQQTPELLTRPGAMNLHDALIVTAEDADGHLSCSSFVHRVLDESGARPKAPPSGQAFIDLSDFPTDEPVVRGLFPGPAKGWLLKKMKELVDADKQSVDSCKRVLATVECHLWNATPVPDRLRVGNFVTPSDLSLSPSFERLASRYRLPNGEETGWVDPLALPPFGAALP